MTTWMILFDPDTPNSLALVQALSQVGQADLVSSGQVNVTAPEKKVNQVCDQYPDAVLKAELMA